MPLPWVSIIDGLLGVTDLVRGVRGRAAAKDIAFSSGRLEARVAAVAVSAIKEAFSRDQERAEAERRRLEEERERQERLIRLEWLRQAGDREMARLRVAAGVAVACWIGSLLLAGRILAGGAAARTLMGLGWAFLWSALAAAFLAQSGLARTLTRLDDRSPLSEVSPTMSGAAAPWLIVAGLVFVGMGALVS